MTSLSRRLYIVVRQARNKAMAWQAIQWINGPEKHFEMDKKYTASPPRLGRWVRPSGG